MIPAPFLRESGGEGKEKEREQEAPLPAQSMQNVFLQPGLRALTLTGILNFPSHLSMVPLQELGETGISALFNWCVHSGLPDKQGQSARWYSGLAMHGCRYLFVSQKSEKSNMP
jgi:hypothetical protein